MEITGILVKQVAVREGVSQRNGQPWKIAEYLLEIPGFDSLVGKTVTVSFDIDAREYEGRWFNEINAWGILEYINQTQRAANMVAAQNAGTQTPQPETKKGGKDDDLPF